MLRKILNYLMVAAAAALILLGGFILGASAEQSRESTMLTSYPATPGMSSSTTPDMSEFWQVWQLINSDYLRNSQVSDQQKVQGAIGGLVSSLNDPYSEYFTPGSAAQDFEDDVTGNLDGIGVQLTIASDTLTVVMPLDGSPAAKAGLKTGDQILDVGATSTATMSIDDAAAVIRGPAGTSVQLTVMRAGWTKPQVFTITRAAIQAPTLQFSTKDGDIAYIQLDQFNDNAESLFENAIRQAALDGDSGVVLDLRGNPGGYLQVAVDLAGWFLPRGSLVVSQQGLNGTNEVMRADGNAALANIPTVVLVDGGSASAAEILSGALRDDRHIPLVGATTFGKGTVQELDNLPDGGLVKLTIAHWVLPSGKILESGGLVPDYPVSISDAQAAAGQDPQLDKAISVLQQEMKQ